MEKLKYFSKFKLITATKQTTNNRTKRMTTITDEEYEYDATFAAFSGSGSGATPRPGMDAAERQHAAAKQAMLSFSQVAKHAAAATKRRRSPKTRTDYWMMNKHVIRAFNDLESQMKQHPAIMTQSDFNLLKQAISNLRVKLIVHDNISFHELEQLRDKTKQEEEQAEKATRDAFMDKTPGNDQQYFDAKDRYLDLKAWREQIQKELIRVDLRNNHARLMKGEQPLQVPSQHAHIAHATGALLRNILTPETIRRTFISLQMLTQKIRDELVMFLIGADRHKDRHEVIKQIKESCLARAAAKKHARK